MEQTQKLTAKQSSFVDYYCDPGSETYNNAYQSAIKAGYAHTTATLACKHILGNVRVQAAVIEKRAEVQATLAVTAEEVIANARWLIEHGKAKNCGADVRAGNDQLGKIIAIFTESNLKANSMPTINVHMPETKPDKPEVDKPPIRFHQEGA